MAMRFLSVLSVFVASACGLRFDATRGMSRRAAVTGAALTPFAAQAEEAREGGALSATCMGFGCNPYSGTDFNGMPASAAPDNSIPYADFRIAARLEHAHNLAFLPALPTAFPPSLAISEGHEGQESGGRCLPAAHGR